jgi:hypothetical protein
MGDGRREAPGDGAREHGREPGRVVAGREGEVVLEEGCEDGREPAEREGGSESMDEACDQHEPEGGMRPDEPELIAEIEA